MRQGCLVADCDCPEFLLGADGSCRYCGDYASKHQRAIPGSYVTPISEPLVISIPQPLVTPSSSTITPTSPDTLATSSTNTLTAPHVKHYSKSLGSKTIDFAVSEPDLVVFGWNQAKLRKSNKWKDKKFGYIKNPERESGIFYNELLPRFFESFWPYHSDPKSFRRGFKTERERQWRVVSDLKSFQKRIDYIKSDNPSCWGRYENDHK